MAKTNKKSPPPQAINVPNVVHQKFVTFCESQEPVKWPIGATAAKALEEFVERNTEKMKGGGK